MNNILCRPVIPVPRQGIAAPHLVSKGWGGVSTAQGRVEAAKVHGKHTVFTTRQQIDTTSW